MTMNWTLHHQPLQHPHTRLELKISGAELSQSFLILYCKFNIFVDLIYVVIETDFRFLNSIFVYLAIIIKRFTSDS